MSWRHGHRWVYLVTAACMIFLGYGIYVVGRGQGSAVFQKIPASYYLENTWKGLGFDGLLQDNPILIYSLPDGMWMFAVMCVQLWIWGAVFNKYTALWMTIVYIICLANEGLQLIGHSPGTFDVNDLLFMVVGGLLPITIELTLQKSVRWKESKNQH